MRIFIKKITTKVVAKVSPKVAISISALLVAVAIPASVLAWGPDRPTYTQEVPSDHVTFNSITNNPKWGDERNFMQIRDTATNSKFTDTQQLQAGHNYEILILFHNNAASNLNDSGVGIAKGAYARTEIPALVNSGASNVQAMAYVGASNATPSSVYDNINLTNSTNADIALRYVKGSAKMTSNGAVNGQAISESLFSSTGTPLGYDSLNGTLPGCDQYSGYITFTVTADTPGFTFSKDVRLAGTKEWSKNITVNNGSKVEYRLGYANTGTTEQKNVVMKDVLPKGIGYIEGQTDLVNSETPNGERLGDQIDGDGVNIGSYAAGANAYLYFNATINAAPCTTLTNTASVETANGNRQDSATVTVAGDCAAALPTTGPAQVIAGLVGVGAITFGVVYYLKSRRELEDALLHTQAHPITLSTNHPTSAPDAAKADDVEADHKHKHSEHKK